MKTRKENRRSFIVTLTMALLMATTLMGCASKEAAEEIKKTEVTDVKEEVATEAAEVKEAEPTPTPTPEPTAEPTPEPIVYEGIDMESTLPGAEWIGTFNGIIEEPKIIIFNDETNKKLIVENEEKVEFGEGDVLAVFAPADVLINASATNCVTGDSVLGAFCYELNIEEGYKVEKEDINVRFFNYDGEKIGETTCTIVAPKK